MSGLAVISSKQIEAMERIGQGGFASIHEYIVETFVPSSDGDYALPFDNVAIEIMVRLSPRRKVGENRFELYRPEAGTPAYNAAECLKLVRAAQKTPDVLLFSAQAMTNLSRAAWPEGRDSAKETQVHIDRLPRRLQNADVLREYALSQEPEWTNDASVDRQVYEWLNEHREEGKPSYGEETWCRYQRDLRRRFGAVSPRRSRPHGTSVANRNEL